MFGCLSMVGHPPGRVWHVLRPRRYYTPLIIWRLEFASAGKSDPAGADVRLGSPRWNRWSQATRRAGSEPECDPAVLYTADYLEGPVASLGIRASESCSTDRGTPDLLVCGRGL